MVAVVILIINYDNNNMIIFMPHGAAEEVARQRLFPAS
jgi:hypothetical protein